MSFGLRVKSFADGTQARSVRTLDMFLTTLIEAAGGLLRTGSERVILRRPAAEVEADLGAIRDGKAEDPALSPGDEVVVKARRL